MGYRRFAQKQAISLQIQGWTRNLIDGRVEIFAHGNENNLEAYCEILRKGPQFSLVQEVFVKKIVDSSIQEVLKVSNFEIHPDAEWK